ncbi:sugar transferase [Argonema antarcticum A004/B2]|nr:sugar transferase [Argonema antarcticum]MCL1471887.1 sugar transferase [Argonema antarcticum A004/B2]
MTYSPASSTVFASSPFPLFITPHPSTRSKFKRCLDIAGSIVGLLILAILFIPIAIAIKLDSPGSIFYKQKRCGLRGRFFTLYKFRTMIKNADVLKSQIKNEAKGAIFKSENDSRITRVGRFLRRTSLDELPQFWNVLLAEMSLVGTRPPSFDEVFYYNKRHWRRLNVKPGITGEWQVNGRSSVKNFEDIVTLDLRYQRRWSPWYDIWLIFKTIWVVIAGQGAY